MSVMDFDVFFNRIIAIFILYLINNEKSAFIMALQKTGFCSRMALNNNIYEATCAKQDEWLWITKEIVKK